MLIGIDGNEANVEKRVGIGEYAFELLTQLENFQLSTFNFQLYLKDAPRPDLPTEREGWHYRVVGPKLLWTQIGLPIDLYLHKPCPNVFFSPTHYAPRFSPVPTVVAVMDLSYIRYPELFRALDLYQLRSWTAYSVKNAARVVTISEASKRDIMRVYGAAESKVVVTYPGIKKVKSEKLKVKSSIMDELKKKYRLQDQYILFVGTLQPRKNIVRLIEAFSILTKSSKKDVQLILVGKKGWLYQEILAAPDKFGVAGNVRFLDFVSDEELMLLYQNAVFFILPSLYEGFGLPVLDAMVHDCPVIVSKVSSLPEAGGDAALYVDPMDVSDIAAKMQLLFKDEKLRRRLIEKGREHVKKFSWEKTARQTLEVLEHVAHER